MSRRLMSVPMALATVLVLSLSPAALALSPAPVLGAKNAFMGGQGFGAAKPRTVFLGGDPTGLVKSITWQHWGAAKAVGYGSGWCPGQSVASGHPCPAALHVSKLGTCHGRRAYDELAFYFKPGASWVAGTKLNACTGQFQP
jgi:hypothetical protein